MNDIQNTGLMVLSLEWEGGGLHYTFTLHVSEIGISKMKRTSDNSKKEYIVKQPNIFSHTCTKVPIEKSKKISITENQN